MASQYFSHTHTHNQNERATANCDLLKDFDNIHWSIGHLHPNTTPFKTHIIRQTQTLNHKTDTIKAKLFIEFSSGMYILEKKSQKKR